MTFYTLRFFLIYYFLCIKFIVKKEIINIALFLLRNLSEYKETLELEKKLAYLRNVVEWDTVV